eukprot:g9560.t1
MEERSGKMTEIDVTGDSSTDEIVVELDEEEHRTTVEQGSDIYEATYDGIEIQTPTVTVRLNAGVNYRGNGELNWDGRVHPNLEFWQMDVGMDGVGVDNPTLSGRLDETARPVYDENGEAIMDGFEAFRGTVEDYRVPNALGVHFPLLDESTTEEDYEYIPRRDEKMLLHRTSGSSTRGKKWVSYAPT